MTLSLSDQVTLLINLVSLFNRAGNGGADLSLIGGGPTVGSKKVNSTISNLKKNFSDVRIVDMSPGGLSEIQSENLLEFL